MTLQTVRDFWEAHPLFHGESSAELGSLAFFEEHRRVVIEDGYAGRFDERMLPKSTEAVLDLGCGPGMWTVEFLRRLPIKRMVAADLTAAALRLTRERLKAYGLVAETIQQNAERLGFEDATFTHVNCMGVIHHTPDTEACVREIHRVLRPGGTSTIAVYYVNGVLRHWGLLAGARSLLGKLGAGLKGRGREGIYSVRNVAELVRLYDGTGNPIGKAYTRAQFVALLASFRVDEIYFHFFPARSLPFPIPKSIHRVLDRLVPFMIFANVTKVV